MLSWRSHRYKIRPTAPPQQHFRDKIRPAPRKWPVFRDFGPAGRVLSRLEVRRWIAGRIFALNNGGRTITPGPVVVVPGKQQAPENSHVIRLKEVSNLECASLELQRFQRLLKLPSNELRATFLGLAVSYVPHQRMQECSVFLGLTVCRGCVWWCHIWRVCASS